MQFLETVKAEVVEGIEPDEKTGKLPFEAMDKSTIDEKNGFKVMDIAKEEQKLFLKLINM